MRINSRFGEKRNANLILKVNHYFLSNALISGGGGEVMKGENLLPIFWDVKYYDIIESYNFTHII